MFAAKAAKGVNSVELQREAKHRSLLAAKAAEAQAAKEVRVRVTVHAKAASNLIAVDNRQFSMTSDPTWTHTSAARTRSRVCATLVSMRKQDR